MSKASLGKLVLYFGLTFGPVVAIGSASAEVVSEKQDLNITAISFFFLFIAITLVITWWAAKKTHDVKDFYAAGGSITGFQNGLAITGDFVSAVTFLGITGLVFTFGYDLTMYTLAAMSALCLLLITLAEPFRNLGKYTLTDAISYRLNQRPVRALSGITQLVIVIMYLVTQMVGAGALIQLLFGLPYETAVVAIGCLMVIYVSAGGMMATTWVQIIKAVVMLFGITVMAIGTLHHYGFSFQSMYSSAVEVHPLGIELLTPGAQLTRPFDMFSLSMALIFGAIGMPHLLMRLFTVPDVREAYKSVIYSTCFMGFVYCVITFIIGFGAIGILSQHPEFFDASGQLIGGNNMVAIHLSKVIAGDVFYGVISAILFATILAVVAGLTIAGASAISHDLYANVLRRGRATEREEIRVSRVSTLLLGAVSIGLGIVFEKHNVAYLITMVFAVSASANFPLLLLTIYWRGITTRGAVVGGLMGLVSSVAFVILGPTLWVTILGNERPVFPYEFPAIFSMTIAFAGVILVSLTDRSAQAAKDREKFEALYLDIYLGKSIKEAAD